MPTPELVANPRDRLWAEPRPLARPRRRPLRAAASAAMFAFLGVAAVTDVVREPEAVQIASGQVAAWPVSHPVGGLVAAVLVEDGDFVEAGQPLIRLDREDAERDLVAAEKRAALLELRAERLRAFIDDRHTDFIFSTIGRAFPALAVREETELARQRTEREAGRKRLRGLTDAVQTALTEARRRERAATAEAQALVDRRESRRALFTRGLVLENEFIAADKAVAGAVQALAAARLDLVEADRTHAEAAAREVLYEAGLRRAASVERGAAMAELAAAREAALGARARAGSWVLKAPVRGVVHGLTLAASGGAVVPGETVLHVVPLEDALRRAPPARPRTGVYLDLRPGNS